MKDIYTALITPFLDDLSIDYKGIDRIMDNLISQGEDKFLLCGTTSEVPLLKKKERKDIVRYITDKYKDIHIIVGTCSNNTIDVIAQINDYSLIHNIEAFLVTVPYYLKPNQKGIFKHFDMIASSTSRNIMIYNIPSRTGVNIDADTIIDLCKKHKNIIGIKQCGDLSVIGVLKDKLPDFKVYIGDDHLLLEGLNEGADGIISVCSHINYPLISKVCQYRNRKDDLLLKELSSYVFLEPNPSCVKYILSKKGYINNQLRSPFVCINQTSEISIDKYLKTILY